MRATKQTAPVIVVMALAVLAAAAASGSSGSGGSGRRHDRGALRAAPRCAGGQEILIQEAVDAAGPGDLILVSPGEYKEAVNVTKDDLTIRCLDRNKVILEGEFTRENGVRVLGANGVAVENMTARNFTGNGFF
jgi:pectin methylesterase-like acyl-CoA thioesterase